MIRKFFTLLCFCLLGTASGLKAQTIAEKIAGTKNGGDLNPELQRELNQVNKELQEWRQDLKELYKDAEQLYACHAEEIQYKALLQRIQIVRDKIQSLENEWRSEVSNQMSSEQYALWHQPDTTLGDIIIDYGSQNYVYLLTPELASFRLSINSSLPIPRASWEEMLETVLMQNGIGIKQLNPYLRQLYLLKEDRSPIALITNKRADLDPLPLNTRVSFMLTPNPSDVRRIWLFLDKFVNPNSTILQNIGRDILIIAPVGEVRELIKLYDFAVENHGDRDYRIIPLKKADADEMAKVLSAIFDQFSETSFLKEAEREMSEGRDRLSVAKVTRSKPSLNEGGSVQIIALKNIAPAVVVIGTQDELKKAAKIIKEVESQIAGSKEKVIFVYKVKHSSAEDIAKILDKLYALMIKTGAGVYREGEEESGSPGASGAARGRGQGSSSASSNVDNRQQTRSVVQVETAPPPPIYPTAEQLINTGFYETGQYIINPDPVGPLTPVKAKSKEPDRNNFIVDAKTGSILMVVEAEALPKIQELIAKIDVPKTMVQIEALLFEKRLTRANSIGINLLKIGSCAARPEVVDTTCAIFDQSTNPRGIFSFFISRDKTSSGIPAFDLLYSFLISQEDFQINSAPSVVTMNQTVAFISIQEEISISTGQFLVNTNSGEGVLKDAFTRAQYGITIKVTPTVHLIEESEGRPEEPEGDYITLDSEILFDTIQPQSRDPNRPDVVRRKLNNLVRIPDGQSVIIGGLRRRVASDSKTAIPFIGEVPGIGKLFSNTTMADSNTEMFLVLTPRIIRDPYCDFERLKWMEMSRRPGDLPEYLCALEEARRKEKNRLLQGSMTLLFGQDPGRCILSPREYDGW